MAKIKKETPVEPPKDSFQAGGAQVAEKVGAELNQHGRTILIGIGAIVALLILFGIWRTYSNNRQGKAETALGQGFKVTDAQVSASPIPGAITPVYATEKEKAQKAVETFQQAANYGNPTGELARYMIAVNQLQVDRAQGLSQLQQLTGSADSSVAVSAKYALAQAYEADGKYDDAAKLYNDLVSANTLPVTADSARLRLAAIYDKQGKKNEAVELLFTMVKAARELKDKDGKAVDPSSAVREATQELERLDPKRFGELPKEMPEEKA